jgi:rod shape-determining protein MreC
MQRLIGILLAFREYVVCVLLCIISLVLLSSNNNTQVRAVRSYTVGFVGILQDILSVIPNVIELQRENGILRQLNVNLSDEVNRLREARLENLRLRGMLEMRERSPFHLVPADIVGKSLHLLRNTVTLNVGENAGVKPDMPIISESGLVGRVLLTSGHYSVGQLMLNKDFRASAKIQRSRVDGIITWDGGAWLDMKNVAKSQDVKEGDVVTTSEYSSTFPQDIKIGTVSRVTETPGNLFKEIQVTPSVDFPTLEQAFVITALPDTERAGIEKRTSRGK